MIPVAVGGDDQKLLSAVTPDQVVASYRLLEANGDFAQHIVTDLVSVVVVDALEVVDVDQDTTGAVRAVDTLAIALYTEKLLLGAVEQEAAVRNPGQCIGHRHRVQFELVETQLSRPLAHDQEQDSERDQQHGTYHQDRRAQHAGQLLPILCDVHIDLERADDRPRAVGDRDIGLDDVDVEAFLFGEVDNPVLGAELGVHATGERVIQALVPVVVDADDRRVRAVDDHASGVEHLDLDDVERPQIVVHAAVDLAER